MRHHYTIQEGSYRLRPARLDDAAFIVDLRTQPGRNRFINTTSSDVAAQQDWLRRYFERSFDYYFVIEHVTSGEREGTLGIYAVNEEERSAEWGRWMVRPESKAAVASCCLAFDLAFGEMDLEMLHSYVAAENEEVIGLLGALGMRREKWLKGYLSLGGMAHDAVMLRISRSDWKAIG